MTRTLAPVALLFAACLGLLAPQTSGVHAQTPARDPAAPASPLVETSAISGQVVLDGASSMPIRRATVTISSREPSVVRTVVTDDGGRFRVAPLPAGRFTLTVEKAGLVPLQDPRTSAASSVTVAKGQHRSEVTVRMARGAVITGRVLDRHGQPLASVGIVVAERRPVGRQITTRQVRMVGSPGGIRTDDRGIYRAFGLPAGSYVIAVTPPALAGARMATAAELQWARQPRMAASPAPPSGPAVTHAAVYFPGTADLAEAAAVSVAAGEERTGVDVTFDLVATTELTGRVTWEDGEPARNVQIVAAPRQRSVLSSGISPFGRIQPSDANGRFTGTGLVPGQYTIMARATRPGAGGASGRSGAAPPAPPAAAPPGARGAAAPPAPLFWAVAEITAAGQAIDDLTLVLRPALNINGRVVFEPGSNEPPEPVGVNVALATAPESAGATLRVSARGVQPDGSFSIGGLVPGPYLLTSYVSSAAGGARWLVKSATAGGRDVIDAPLDVDANREITDLVVTFTDRVTELSGRVSDRLDQPVSEYYIMVFSVDPAHWRQNSRRLGAPRRLQADGRYLFSGLPPGDYYVAAVPEYEQTIWYTPEYLEQVAPGAIKVTIGEGEKKTQDVKLGI